jgi:hypothetical protein
MNIEYYLSIKNRTYFLYGFLGSISFKIHHRMNQFILEIRTQMFVTPIFRDTFRCGDDCVTCASKSILKCGFLSMKTEYDFTLML